MTSGIVATAYVGTSQGPTPIASRSQPAYSFSGPGILQIGLEGSGTVVGARWLEQGDLPALNFVPWTVLNLPHEGGPRYLSIDGAIARSALRVLEQAPRRRPLQETLGAVPPAAAPVEGPLYEAKRVESLAKPVAPSLDRLVTDLSAPALELIEQRPDLPRLGPAVAGRRPSAASTASSAPSWTRAPRRCSATRALTRSSRARLPLLAFYWVSGFFRDFPPSRRCHPRTRSSTRSSRSSPARAWWGTRPRCRSRSRRWSRACPRSRSTRRRCGLLEPVGDYIGLGALAVADLASPPDPMPAPVIDATTHLGWLPVTPPDARREVAVTLSGVATAGMLAGEKQTPGRRRPPRAAQQGQRRRLPPAARPGHGQRRPDPGARQRARHGLPRRPPGGCRSRSAIRRAAGPVRALVRMGVRGEPPGPRPAPPRPVIRGTYTQPADPVDERRRDPGPGRHPAAGHARPGCVPDRPAGADRDRPHDARCDRPRREHRRPARPRRPPSTSPSPGRSWRPRSAGGSSSSPSGGTPPAARRWNPSRRSCASTTPARRPSSASPTSCSTAAGRTCWGSRWSSTPGRPVAGQAGFGIYYTDENRLTAYLAGSADGTAGATRPRRARRHDGPGGARHAVPGQRRALPVAPVRAPARRRLRHRRPASRRSGTPCPAASAC